MRLRIRVPSHFGMPRLEVVAVQSATSAYSGASLHKYHHDVQRTARLSHTIRPFIMASLEPKSAQDSRGRESSPVASEQQTLDTGDVPPAAGPVPPPNASTTPPDVPYSAFGKRDKWIIVALTSFASLFR
jgi:hypothetical protein